MKKFKLKNAKCKMFHFAICILQFAFAALIFSGCAATGEIQTGRFDLLYGDSNMALVHFQRAAEIDPQFLYYSVLPQGVWTYVGRAYYNTGKYPEARQAFERALARYDRDNLARLYLGLALSKAGEPPRGLTEIQAGMKGLYDWMEALEQQTLYGRYWDPGRDIRRGIEKNLIVANAKEIDWPTLIAGGEWLGKRMEEEIDRARRDQKEDFERNGSDRTDR
jgi:tetratricopeptide (TPR) repeat protein